MTLCLALGTPGAFGQDGLAVVGSFKNLAYAEATVLEVQSELAHRARISTTVIDGVDWYRVIVDDVEPEAMVLKLLAHGFQDAWFLPVAKRVAESQPKSRSLAQEPRSNVGAPVASTPRPMDASVVQPIATLPVDQSSGHQRLIEVLDGIPRHHIVVPNIADEDAEIVIDGYVDEAVWGQVPEYDNMRVAIPGTGEPGAFETEFRLLATDRGLYVSAVMHQPPETLVSRMSTRDDFIDRDLFGVTIDTTGEGLFGYWFYVALGDSLMDGKVLPERNYMRDWDGPWVGKSAVLDYGWSAEMLLPWSMMNLPKVDGARKVGFAVQRQVSHANQRYQWPGYPYSSSRFVTALNTMEVAGVEPRQQFSIIPYASTTVDEARGEDDVRVGADIAWKPSPKLEMTGTVMPDFGAVEADDVVLNLTAFETFFPEKRLFFLEGNEIFATTPRSGNTYAMRTLTNDNFATTSRMVRRSDFFPTPISLMNTRRIGGTANQVEVPQGVVPQRGERDLPTELLGAAKVTGTAGDLRYGVFSALEDDVEWFGTDGSGRTVDIEAEGRDFAAARLLYENVDASRRSIGYLGTFVSGPIYDAVVHGIDGHYTSSNGRFNVDTQWVSSDVDGITGNGALLDFKYSQSPSIQHKLDLDYFDEDVNIDDLGFLRRNDYAGAQYVLLYNRPLGAKGLKDIRGAVALRQEYNISKGQVVDSGIYWRNSMVLPGRNTLKTALAYLPERWEDRDSRGNGSYRVHERWWADLQIATDSGKQLSFSTSIGALQEHLGDWTYEVAGGVTYRPSDRLALDFDIRYKRRDGWLVYQGDSNFGSYHGPDWQPTLKVDWFMSASHQLRLSLQWAGVRAEAESFWTIPAGDGELVPAAPTQPNHDFTVSILTAQLRYRWEIAPLTDLYVVYNLGNTLASRFDSSIDDLFLDGFDDPIVESFVVKLRYRFGN